MGYYVNIVFSNTVLSKKNQDEAYEIMCELNNCNDFKNGGSYPIPSDVDMSKPNKHIWFSWMDWDYPKKCKNAKEILNQLGFLLSEKENGDITIDAFDNKTGAEKTFINSIGHLLTGTMYWHGESGEYFKWDFDESGVIETYGYIQCEDGEKFELVNHIA